MAQQSVLRVWCDERGSRRVALPGLSHLLRHELDGPQLLHGFCYERLTDRGDRTDRLPSRGHPRAAGRGRYWSCRFATAAICCRRGTSWASSRGRAGTGRCRCTSTAPGSGSPSRISVTVSRRSPDWPTPSTCRSTRAWRDGRRGRRRACRRDRGARRWRTRLGGTLATLMPYAVAGLRGLRESCPGAGLPRAGPGAGRRVAAARHSGCSRAAAHQRLPAVRARSPSWSSTSASSPSWSVSAPPSRRPGRRRTCPAGRGPSSRWADRRWTGRSRGRRDSRPGRLRREGRAG